MYSAFNVLGIILLSPTNVCSRDAIMHIADKRSLYKSVYSTLKPGGTIFITEYCQGDKVNSVLYITTTHRQNKKGGLTDPCSSSSQQYAPVLNFSMPRSLSKCTVGLNRVMYDGKRPACRYRC